MSPARFLLALTLATAATATAQPTPQIETQQAIPSPTNSDRLMQIGLSIARDWSDFLGYLKALAVLDATSFDYEEVQDDARASARPQVDLSLPLGMPVDLAFTAT